MGLLYRIIAAGVPWMAASQPFKGHGCALEHAVSAVGFKGILRAGRTKAADLGKKRSDGKLISFDQI
jgi:hypothetical protein